jgi:hypothetical protein
MRWCSTSRTTPESSAIAFAVLTYLLFDTILGVRIPDGVLTPLVRAVGLS